MKICFITTTYFPYESGGVPTVIANYTNILSEKGVEFVIITQYASKKKVKIHEIPSSTKLISIKIPFSNSLDKLKGGGYIKNIFCSLLLPLYLLKLKLKDKPDVLVATDPFFIGIPTLLFIKIFRKIFGNPFPSFMVSIHGEYIDEHRSQPLIGPIIAKIIAPLSHYVLKRCDIITANGQDTVDILRARGIKNRIVLCYNGVDINKFNTNINGNPIRNEFDLQNNFVITFIGSLRKIKGQECLVKIAPIIKKEINNVKYLFVGKGDRTTLEGLAKKLGVENDVIFTGERSDINEILAASDIFCFTGTIGRGLLLAQLEAMASGKPTVTFYYGAIPEIIIDGFNGFLIDKKNYISMSSCILRLLKDIELRSKIGENARLTAENFSWENVSLSFLKATEEAILRSVR